MLENRKKTISDVQADVLLCDWRLIYSHVTILRHPNPTRELLVVYGSDQLLSKYWPFIT